MSEQAERFAHLFGGRYKAYGSGGGYCVREDATVEVFRQHLEMTGFDIGIYPMWPHANDNWLCKWGCIDLDIKSVSKPAGDYASTNEAWVAAQNLRNVLRSLDISAYVEITRSNGYHVWVFSTPEVAAAHMRRALLFACQVADVKPTEVNPKAEGFPDNETLGNFVRLPYPRSHGVRGTQVMLDEDGDELSLDSFLETVYRTAAFHVVKASSLYVPPATNVSDMAFERSADLAQTWKKCGGLTRWLVDHEPMDGDRSKRLFRVAIKCHEDKLTPDEAVAVVAHADHRHGQKFVGRSDAETRYRETVRRAYDR